MIRLFLPFTISAIIYIVGFNLLFLKICKYYKLHKYHICILVRKNKAMCILLLCTSFFFFAFYCINCIFYCNILIYLRIILLYIFEFYFWMFRAYYMHLSLSESTSELFYFNSICRKGYFYTALLLCFWMLLI